MDMSEISAALREEGAKRGFTTEQISKTLKQIKKGKINLDSLAPMLTSKLTNNFNSANPSKDELKQRLSKKISDSRNSRLSKGYKNKNNEGDDSNNVQDKTIKNPDIKKAKPGTRKNKNKRLNKLAKKYGYITPETYIESLTFIKSLSGKEGNPTESDLIEKNRHINIINIYEKQNSVPEAQFDGDGDGDGFNDESLFDI